MSNKFERILSSKLEASGLPWSIERGAKHNAVILAGKRIGIFSIGIRNHRDDKKLCSAIRQRQRELSK